MSFLTLFAFLRFDHGARALIANYRGQRGGRQGPAVSSEGNLTQISSEWSWMSALDMVFVWAIL